MLAKPHPLAAQPSAFNRPQLAKAPIFWQNIKVVTV
ncbi:MAG: hypothetical protein RLZZ471_941 [Actinomycetota bacterium]